MKTKDLRIGNAIIADENGVMTQRVISGITYDEVIYAILVNGVKKYYINPIENIKPIILTEDLLLELGARRFCKDFTLKGVIIHTRKRGFIINTKIPQIEYVHQLQNVIYALREKEINLINEL